MNEEAVIETPDQTVTETTATEVPNGQDEATAAAAAFATSRGETPPEPVKTEAVKAETPNPADEPEAETPKLFAGMTEAQIAEALSEIPKYRKQIDNLAGNNGKLNAALQKLQQDLSVSGGTVTDEDFAELAEQYPELAGMTKNAMNKVMGRMRGTGAAQPPEEFVSLARQAAMEVAEKERVRTHIDMLHAFSPGWDKVVGLPGEDGQIPETPYRKWLATQPAEYQTKMAASNNALEIDSSIKLFKAAQEAATQKQQQNKQRLANAVQPEGQTAARGVISEQSAADKAFNERRRR